MDRIRIWFSLSILLTGTLILSQTAVRTQAQPTSQERIPLVITDYLMLPHLELDTTPGQRVLPPIIPDGDPPINNIGLWSRMVFQSYRDGVWNIYSSRFHGSELQQLTNEAAHNIHPDFNRGTNQIVFASQSPNGFAIHRMNSDGSHRVALTNTAGDDVYPRWSPDGSKIVFESYRDGQAEIYVMNADGSQLQRLTYHPGFDGMPTWSPDGSKIAFVSQRSGLLRIWVMNADGSNPVQISQTPSSVYPAWSPDSTKIAYSADSNQDGWLEVWVMNADGTNAHHVRSPLGNQDFWVRGWSPDSRYITYTQVNFVQYNGAWFWTDALLRGINPNNNMPAQIHSSLYDWHPHWQTSDAIAPIVSLHHHPDYAPPEPLLCWEGTDVGIAGFLNFDVQYRPASSGQWQDWLMGITETEANLTAPLGDSYIFRIRGRDHAFNVSDWQVSPRPLTLYAWKLQGHMTDNAGVPVRGATIETTPPPFLFKEADSAGQFALYVDQILSSYQVSWQKPGYGSLPTTHYGGGHTEAQAHIVLPPTDDLVENGSFELGNLGPAWQAVGEYTPNVISTAFNTGHYAAALGREMLDPTISEWDEIGGAASTDHKAVFDNNGRLHLLWKYGQQLHYSQRTATGIWTTPVILSPQTGPIRDMEIVVDSNNIIHVIWQQQIEWIDDVYYKYLADDEWSTTVNLTAFATSPTWSFRIAATDDGIVHVLLPVYGNTGSLLYYRERDLAGNWSDPLLLIDQMVANALLKSQGNTLHLVTAVGSYTEPSHYRQKTSGGSWSIPQTVPVIATMNQFELLIAPNGQLHLLSWRSNGPGLYHSRRSVAGQWSSPYLVTQQNVSPLSLRFLVTPDNSLHLLWNVNSSMPYDPQEVGLHYTRRLANGQWTAQQWVWSNGAAIPRMFDADEVGNLHLLFGEFGANASYYLMASPEGRWAWPPLIISNSTSELRGKVEVGAAGVIHLLQGTWRHALLTLSGGESTLSQTITIPAEMTDRYLSFVYRMAGASPALNTGLTINLSTDNETMVLAHIEENVSDWTQVSLPLADWAGETITLTWDVPQPVLAIPVSVGLDDVTLGSAHPDVWLAPLPRQLALPGETVSYQLVYGNQGGAAATAVSVTLPIPANLLFVSAIPAPTTSGTSLTWELGDLPPFSDAGTIELTLAVADQAPLFTILSTTAVIGTLDLELELLNNERPLRIFVGREQYLPIVAASQ